MKIREYTESRLIIECDLDNKNFTLLSQLPGYKKWLGRELVFKPSGSAIEYLLYHFKQIEWIGKASDKYKHYQSILSTAEEITKDKHIDFTGEDPENYKYHRKPMQHQHNAFMISRNRPVFGLFMEQGTGKTKVTLDTANYLYLKGEIDTLIIIAWPNGVHRNWITNELPADFGKSVKYVSEFWSANLTKEKQAEIDAVLNAKGKLKVMSFNVEAFVSPKAQDCILKFLQAGNCLLAIDQSASIKNPQAKRTKFIIDKLSKLAKYKRILDGAPVAEGASELYSQFKFLDPLIIGHDTWTGFRSEYCRIGYFKEIIGYKNLEKLREKIDGHSYRVLADDCLDLPEKIYKVWNFELGKNERRIYEELKKQNLAYFKHETVEGEHLESIEENLAMVKNMRLQQIGSGWWPEVDNVKSIEERPTRLEELLSLLKQAEGKVIIFSRFRADIDVIEKALGDKAVSYHGGIKEDDRELAKKRFMQDEDILYFIGQPRNAGIGHTLTAAKHIVFYSNDSSLRFREECERRAYRKGLAHKLIIWDLIANNTNDQKILWCFRNKKDLAEEIMRDPKQFFLTNKESI